MESESWEVEEQKFDSGKEQGREWVVMDRKERGQMGDMEKLVWLSGWKGETRGCRSV